MSLRPIDKTLLASFLEYAANGVVTMAEWRRFAINHYEDSMMEDARAECVRILCANPDPQTLLAEDRQRLHHLARGLRESI